MSGDTAPHSKVYPTCYKYSFTACAGIRVMQLFRTHTVREFVLLVLREYEFVIVYTRSSKQDDLPRASGASYSSLLPPPPPPSRPPVPPPPLPNASSRIDSGVGFSGASGDDGEPLYKEPVSSSKRPSQVPQESTAADDGDYLVPPSRTDSMVCAPAKPGAKRNNIFSIASSFCCCFYD